MHILHKIKFMVSVFVLISFSTVYANEANISRPLPTDDPRATSVQYIFPVSPSQAYPVVLDCLKKRFLVTYAERENKSDVERFGKYGDIRSDYVYCDQTEKKCREKCYALVHIVPGYPNYSLVTVGCDLERWKSRFGAHNLFDWKWDWIGEGEQTLFLAADMLEMVREGLGFPTDKVIRLRKYYSRDDIIPLINEYEKKW